MEMTATILSCAIFACLASIVLGLGKLPDTNDIDKKHYCHGCEYTIKALYDMILQPPFPKDSVDERVAESLSTVCSEEHLNNKMTVKACEFLLEENENALVALLVSHFSRRAHTTFLDLSHQVCMDLSQACLGMGEKRFPDDLDSDLEFDRDDQTFRVKKGRNLRIPEPMRAKEDL